MHYSHDIIEDIEQGAYLDGYEAARLEFCDEENEKQKLLRHYTALGLAFLAGLLTCFFLTN
jgi:hypothetical protein